MDFQAIDHTFFSPDFSHTNQVFCMPPQKRVERARFHSWLMSIGCDLPSDISFLAFCAAAARPF